MKKRQAVELLLNGEKRDHGQVIAGLLKKAERLECMAAFAKTSAFQGVLEALQASLAHGLEARFAIGLDFYLTEPALLRKLMEMGKKHTLELYLSASSETFHPKIYALRHIRGCSVLIGSANLTAGGLCDNYEASALVDDPEGALTASITQHFNELNADGTLVRATKLRIDDYARDYVIHDACRKVARRCAANVNHADGISIEVLRDILELMKSDSSSNGFKSQQTLRGRNLRKAQRKLGELASLSGAGRRGF